MTNVANIDSEDLKDLVSSTIDSIEKGLKDKKNICLVEVSSLRLQL